MDVSPPSHLTSSARDDVPLERLVAIVPDILDRAAALDAVDAALPEADLAALTAAGLLVAALPVSFGGCGWGSEPRGGAGLFEALRLLGRASLPLGRLFEGHASAVGLVMRHGTPAQQEAAAEAVHRGLLFGGWGCEAPPAALELEGGVLRGAKVLCSGAGLVERALVTARLDAEGARQMVLVPMARFTPRANFADWTPTGMRASATASVDLDGIAVTPDLLIGQPDVHLGLAEYAMSIWRPLAVQLGGLEAVAEAMRTHLRRTGRGDNPHQAARLGGVLTAAETARLWVREAYLMAESLEARPEQAAPYVNLARGAVERAALDVIEAANRSVGLSGFMRPNPMERQVRDLSTYLRQPSPDQALVSAAAAGLELPHAVGTMWSNDAPNVID